MARPRLLTALILATAFLADGALAQMPPAIAAPGEDIVATFHAEGAQIYECKPGSDGKLAWVFREPIATLLLADKAVGNAPGATVNDIPWLKLDVVNRRGSGTLADVTTVQRTNTHGGAAQGACDQAGAFRSVPYSADYVFLSKRK